MPLDQMHSANPPSHPELLAWLARDMADHGYDLRRLIRGLVLSQAYARESRWDGDAGAPTVALRRRLVRPLTPMQLATSLRLATTDPTSLRPTCHADAIRETDRGRRGKRPGARRVVRQPGGDSQIGVAEALLFSNGKKIAQRSLGRRAATAWSAASSRRRTAELIDLAVRNVLSRRPDDDEARTLGGYPRRTHRPARRRLPSSSSGSC